MLKESRCYLWKNENLNNKQAQRREHSGNIQERGLVHHDFSSI